MTMLSKEELARIRERASRATPGPWEPCLGSGMHECTAIHFEGDDQYPYGLFVCDLIPDYVMNEKYKPDLEFKSANMEFISHTRTDIPALLAHIEVLEKERDRLTAQASVQIQLGEYFLHGSDACRQCDFGRVALYRRDNACIECTNKALAAGGKGDGDGR